jgi:hypothetical protein
MPEDEFGSVPLPDARPDTYLTGDHPSSLESGFLVHFHWDAYDPDGAIRGFQWRMSDNGTDGISVQDTLTRDPATGQILNPWHFTTATETTLVVSADMPDYPVDAGQDAEHRRAWQTHTMFVRAMDDAGGVDPTPAMISFTATTLVPRIRVDFPSYMAGYGEAQAVPPQAVFGFTGWDPDGVQGNPSQYRYMVKRSWLNGHYIRSRYEFEQHAEQLISLQDSAWSDWLPYPLDPTERRIVVDKLPRLEPGGEIVVYLLVLQVRDEAMATSAEMTYAINVQNFYIGENLSPLLVVEEDHLGHRDATGVIWCSPNDIAPRQEVSFRWDASADHYGGSIVSYRYGWDLQDPDNPDDPAWSLAPGLGSQHTHSAARSFDAGTHTLYIETRDNSDQLTRLCWVLEVVPVPPPESQQQLLLVDDVLDHLSQGWASAAGVSYDNDWFRDRFWEETLGGAGGVQNWSTDLHLIDTEDRDLTLRDIVGYRVVLYTSRWAITSQVRRSFPPEAFNWLAAYQESVGNVFMVGSRVLSQFLADDQWMLPWIFTSTEPPYISGWFSYLLSFGARTMVDGTVVNLGKVTYPYEIAGLSALDHFVPTYTMYGIVDGTGSGSLARSYSCAGLKALLLDQTFRDHHLTGGLLPDTIRTDTAIDWADQVPQYRNHLEPWIMINDEFYDANITSRPTPWQPQECDGQPCVEPMFRAYTRFDYVMDEHRAMGDDDWPQGTLSGADVSRRCGYHALDPLTGRTRITGKPVAFISHKHEALTPSHRGDVYWGFDPYRFDHEAMSAAIRWVLGEHFGLLMQQGR